MPRSAVVDTSVLVSAFLFPNSVPGRVLALADQGVYALHFSPIILEEFSRSLRNPRLIKAYPYTEESVNQWLDDLHKIGSLFLKPLAELDPVCRDPDDDHVIAAALAVEADTATPALPADGGLAGHQTRSHGLWSSFSVHWTVDPYRYPFQESGSRTVLFGLG